MPEREPLDVDSICKGQTQLQIHSTVVCNVEDARCIDTRTLRAVKVFNFFFTNLLSTIE